MPTLRSLLSRFKARPVVDVVSNNPQFTRSPRARRALPQTLNAIRSAQKAESRVFEAPIRTFVPKSSERRAVRRTLEIIPDNVRLSAQAAPRLINLPRPKNRIGRAGVSILEDQLRAPLRLGGGLISTLGNELDSRTRRRVRPTKRLSDLATGIEGGIDIASFGLGGGLLKSGIKSGAKKGFRRAARIGAATGGTAGFLRGLQNRDAKDVTDQVIGSLDEAAIGTLLGGLIGGGANISGRFIGKGKKAMAKELKNSFRLIRDSAGNIEAQPRRVRNTKFGPPGAFKSERGAINLGEILTLGGRLGRRNQAVKIDRQSLINEAKDLALGKTTTALPAITRKARDLRQLAQNLPQVDDNIRPKQKVNLFDRFKTPTEVFKRMGLGNQGEALKFSLLEAKLEIPKHIEKIRSWQSRIDPKRKEVLFDFLDGKKVDLSADELDVAREVRAYTEAFADRLKLPKDRRITNYITRLFDPNVAQKEFDPAIARVIEEEIPGSVFNPFLQRRKGAEGFIKDPFKALEAYAKRGVRKAQTDAALGKFKEATKGILEPSQIKFVKDTLERVNMRPTRIDNEIDNFIKSTPIGYKLGQRPFMNFSRAVRQMVYRGTIGGNLSTPIKNLTQGVNTYSKLGERYTLTGYAQALRPSSADELRRAGVLEDSFIQDQSLPVIKSVLNKVDEALFFLFQQAEKINRGAAYYGARQKALDAGKSMDEAIIDGLNLARETQFTFGAVDTPPILASDLGKSLGQFQSFNLKQLEFLKNMVKNKQVAGLVRWTLANAIIAGTIGKTIGLDFEDSIPFLDVATGDSKLGRTPPVELGAAVTTSVIPGVKDKFGQDVGAEIVGKALVPFIPAGVQIRKTLQGIKAAVEGVSTTKSGKVRFPIKRDPISMLKTAVFGQYQGDLGRFYFNKELSPLSEKDGKRLQRVAKQGGDTVSVWKQIYSRKINKRYRDKVVEIRKKRGMSITEKRIEMGKAKKQAERLLGALEAL